MTATPDILAPTPLRRNASSSSNGSGATLDAILTVEVAAGQLFILEAHSGALGGVSGASNEHVVTGIAGLTKELEYTRDVEPSRPGVTHSRWRIRPTVTIPAGTVVTLTCSGAVACRALRGNTYDCGDPTNTLIVLGLAGDHGSTGGASNPAVALTPSDWDDACWVGSGSFDGDDNLAVPVPSGWAENGAVVQNGGNNFTGLTAFGHARVVEALSQIYTVAAGSDRRWVMLLGAYTLRATAADPVVGARQFQADFDTPTDGNSGTSTARRPDAVSVDYLLATSVGPSAVGVAGLPQDYTWLASAREAGRVTLARRTEANNAWEAAAELFTYTGAAIAEIFNALAFDRDGRVVLAAERPTGTAGAAEVWLYKWNPATPGYEFVQVDTGRTPRVVLDAFPHLTLLCAPTPDVQLVYLKPGTGLVRRESRDQWVTLYGSPLPEVPNIWLEAFFPTDNRVLSVIYLRRNRTTGEVKDRRVDSLPFPDSLLLPPRFYPGNTDDITFFQGTEFLGSSGQVTVEQLRVGVLEDVDAIEVQATTTDFNDATGWLEQNQEQDGGGSGFNAGDSVQFPFTINHGGGAMSPRGFRARTRKQVGDVTCWSAWLYFIAGRGTDTGSATLLLHDDTGHTDQYEFTAAEGWVTYIPVGGTSALRTQFAGSVTLVMQEIFNPALGGGWQPAFRLEVQGTELINFLAPEGRYVFTLLSRIHFSSAQNNEWLSLPPFNANQQPGPFPPNPVATPE